MKDYSVFAEENRQEYADVLQALTEIPSPSNKENRIAKWIRELLCGYAEKSGYDQVRTISAMCTVNWEKHLSREVSVLR